MRKSGERARRAARSAGFSLVEMLVALGIVALLALAGIDLLRGTVASEQVLRRHDGEAARLRRFIALWRADLAQAQALGTRDAEGAPVPAFRVGGAGGLVQLVRGGRPNPEGLARGPLEKLVWRWDGQALVRVAFEQPDGSAPDEALAVLPLASAPRLWVRDRAGVWRAVGDQGWTAPPDGLPLAMQIELRPAGLAGPLRLIVPVGCP